MSPNPTAQEAECYLALLEGIEQWRGRPADSLEDCILPVHPAISRISLRNVRIKTSDPSSASTNAVTHRQQRLKEQWQAFDVVQQLRKIIF